MELLPDLGTVNGVAVVVMAVIGVAKWTDAQLQGNRTRLIVALLALMLAVVHAVLTGERGALELERALLTGLGAAVEALGLSALVRAAGKTG